MTERALQQYLAKEKKRVDRLLDAALPKANERPELLSQAMRYAVFAGGGGKRLRPILCLMLAKAFSGSDEAAEPAAVALELFHNYTLVHDDLPCMDNDAMRRGEPAVHKQFGEWQAVLAGDALQQLAFRVLALNESKRAQTILALFSDNSVIKGQVEDLLYNKQATREQLDYIHQNKTANLFFLSTLLGVYAAGARMPSKALRAAGVFGYLLGIAFQIVDDLLDASDGKTQKELSILNLMSVAEAQALAARHTQTALDQLNAFTKEPAALQALTKCLLKRVI